MIARSWILIIASILFAQSPTTHADANLLNMLKSGNHLAVMRHELAPGTGDPATFNVRECATQRNLNDQGRSQSIATGNFLRNQGITFEAVYSSQWCRCLETAKLLNHGPVQELPVINSFFQSMHLADERTQALRDWLGSKTMTTPILLVTHQVNISALTGVYARSGEIIVLELKDAGQVIVKGTLTH